MPSLAGSAEYPAGIETHRLRAMPGCRFWLGAARVSGSVTSGGWRESGALSLAGGNLAVPLFCKAIPAESVLLFQNLDFWMTATPLGSPECSATSDCNTTKVVSDQAARTGRRYRP